MSFALPPYVNKVAAAGLLVGLIAACYASPSPAEEPLISMTQAGEPRPFGGPAGGILHIDTVRVEDSGGGSVDTFLDMLHQWNVPGVQVQVQLAGSCYSACTLFLGAKHVCAMPGTILFLHAPYAPLADHIRGYDATYTAWFTQQYPKPVQDWIEKNGGLKVDYLTLGGETLKQFVPIC